MPTAHDFIMAMAEATKLALEISNKPEVAQIYFDYEAYARDLSFGSYYETENGVLVAC